MKQTTTYFIVAVIVLVIVGALAFDALHPSTPKKVETIISHSPKLLTACQGNTCVQADKVEFQGGCALLDGNSVMCGSFSIVKNSTST